MGASGDWERGLRRRTGEEAAGRNQGYLIFYVEYCRLGSMISGTKAWRHYTEAIRAVQKPSDESLRITTKRPTGRHGKLEESSWMHGADDSGIQKEFSRGADGPKQRESAG